MNRIALEESIRLVASRICKERSLPFPDEEIIDLLEKRLSRYKRKIEELR
jgi:hypothetical protein